MRYRWFAPPSAGEAGRPRAAACRRRSGASHLLALAAAVLAPWSFGASGASAQLPVTGAPPSAIPLATTPIGGWSAWSPVAGPSFLSPTIAFNPAAGALEVAEVGLDLGVSYTRVANGIGSPMVPSGSLTFLPPALLLDAAGTPQLLVTGTGGMVTHSRLQAGAWSAPAPTGAVSFLPPAAVLDSAGGVLELITVGTDGGVRHSRFLGGAWGSTLPLNVVTFLPPSLAANPAGGLDLAIVGLDRQVYHAQFAGTQWSAFGPTGVFTDVAPAIVVTTAGVVHLAATGLDREVVHTRLVNGAWTAPVPTGIQSALSPALAFSSGGNSVELLARAPDRTVQHARFLNGAWTAPVSLGIRTDTRPALAATAGAIADAAVTAVDGRVYASRFAGSAAPPTQNAAAVPSFSKDILRIFTNNGLKTCAQPSCHAGPFAQLGMNLEPGQAYQNIVNVASAERPNLKRVLPGDAANSYLFLKISGGNGIAGDRMPLAGGPLSPADVELLRQWINGGAPNN